MKTHQIIANYRLLGFLGSGGMGEVWLAQHRHEGYHVAIKGLHSSLVSNHSVRERFRNEAETLENLQHPNIVTMYDYIEDASGVYLVMEYVKGDGLDDYIRQKTGPIPEAQAIELFGQILQGVAFAHTQNIVHRDIKPSNFLVTDDLRVKILDFGIAKALQQNKQLTKTGTRLGTVLYMSPEQVKGERLDQRSDIYALGITLFQMLTGQCPYDAEESEFIVYNKIVHEQLPRANTLYPVVSPHMQAVIDRATAKAPNDRFQNCGSFLAALSNAAFQGPALRNAPAAVAASHAAASTAQQQRGPKGGRKKRHWLRYLIPSILLLAAIAILWTGAEGYWPILGKERPRDIAEEFLTAVKKGDYRNASRYADGHCQDFLDEALGDVEEWRDELPMIYNIKWESVNLPYAYVYYDRVLWGKTASRDLLLKRSWGTWKILCNEEDF